MTQVIYKIINRVNDKFYVGSTTNTKVRFRTHRNKLRRGAHHCAHLQAAWGKYGEVKFDFVVVQEVAAHESLQDAEDVWLSEHVGKPHCYNAGTRSGAPMRGRTGAKHPSFGKQQSPELRERISDTLKAFYAEDYNNHPRVGTQHSDATKDRIRQAKLANPTKAWLGKERSAETKEKISAAQRGVPKPPGRKVSAEGLAKIAANIAAGRSHRHWAGRTHTAEARAKMSKPVAAMHVDGRSHQFVSLVETLAHFGFRMPTLNRALKTGVPISKGAHVGWRFEYVVT